MDGIVDEDYSSETNWTIASGSLRTCITFQSSLSFQTDSVPESTPLILNPPLPDSPPCQIKSLFSTL